MTARRGWNRSTSLPSRAGHALGDLGLAALAVRKGGIVGDVDDRRGGQQLAGRPQHRQPADPGIEEEEGGGRDSSRRCGVEHDPRQDRTAEIVADAAPFATTAQWTGICCLRWLSAICSARSRSGSLLTRFGGQGRRPRDRVGQYRRDQCASDREQAACRADLAPRCAQGDRRDPDFANAAGPGRRQLCRRRRDDRPSLSGLAALQGREGGRDLSRRPDRVAAGRRELCTPLSGLACF